MEKITNSIRGNNGLSGNPRVARKRNGTTVIELLFALCLLSVLTALSLPNIRETLLQRAGLQALRRVDRGVAVARSTAIKTSSLVTFCPSADSTRCGGSWSEGFIAFTDGNGNRQVDEEDILAHVQQFGDLAGTLRWRAFQNRQYLQITSQGFTRYQNGNFTYCPKNERAELARQLIINRTARARYSKDSDGDGVREDSRGRPLSCG